MEKKNNIVEDIEDISYKIECHIQYKYNKILEILY